MFWARLNLMTRYFVFLVINGFIVVTLSSGLIASLPLLAKNPGSIAGLLATNLPTASNFYLSYLTTTGLGGAGSSLLQIVTLALYYVFLFLLASTPRKVFKIKFKMEGDEWGTLFPATTIFVVIGLAYTTIAPCRLLANWLSPGCSQLQLSVSSRHSVRYAAFLFILLALQVSFHFRMGLPSRKRDRGSVLSACNP